MKKQICLLFFISITSFEGMCTSPQNKVDSVESIRQAYNNCDYEVFFSFISEFIFQVHRILWLYKRRTNAPIF